MTRVPRGCGGMPSLIKDSHEAGVGTLQVAMAIAGVGFDTAGVWGAVTRGLGDWLDVVADWEHPLPASNNNVMTASALPNVTTAA